MKITYRQIEAFVKQPDPAARVILVYGPDAGLMKERAHTMARTAVEDINDPFNVAVLTAENLTEDPARLADEANAISMMGGGRLIRVENAGDKLTVLVKTYLENPNEQTLVILEAGELGPRSSLRSLCEKAKNAAAVPCYVEDERDLSRLIRDIVQQAGKRIDNDAVSWLAANIGGNRQRARGEIEKLLTYKGAEDSAISLEDAREACGEIGAQGLDELVYSIGGQDSAKALRIYNQLLAEGVSFIMMLRALQNHFRRLHVTRARMEAGDSLDGAVKSLAPPLFFKQEPLFRAQLQKWQMPGIAVVLQRLNDLEAQCKQTGAPVETLCAQAVLGISAMRR